MFLTGSRVVPLVSHAVGNLGAHGEGIRIVAVPGDEYSVSSVRHGKGTHFVMGALQLFLEGFPAVPATAWRVTS
ncbi:hypothetical protein SAMN04489742_4652 [Arthrobacter crystallopoietes]|uniref:Uncharacterized protein n=1 Tax=Crystallibacter crystallopoietes TaxID=37928 RepID=A0A1H1HU35_9MICC|nr:hypothetical protein SAMN04489742_4652 [Arthrobacter crystallopoietes]